jgi:hypothetical protein
MLKAIRNKSMREREIERERERERDLNGLFKRQLKKK